MGSCNCDSRVIFIWTAGTPLRDSSIPSITLKIPFARASISLRRDITIILRLIFMLKKTEVQQNPIWIPVNWFPTLRDATADQRNNWRFIGDGEGIHWEDLDEDILVEGLL